MPQQPLKNIEEIIKDIDTLLSIPFNGLRTVRVSIHGFSISELFLLEKHYSTMGKETTLKGYEGWCVLHVSGGGKDVSIFCSYED